MAVQATLIVVVTTAVIALGHFFHVAVGAAHLWGTSLGVLLLGIDLGLVALAVGALTGRRGTAIGVASAIAAASYLVSSLAPVVCWIRPARFASLFYWSVGNNQLTRRARASASWRCSWSPASSSAVLPSSPSSAWTCTYRGGSRSIGSSCHTLDYRRPRTRRRTGQPPTHHPSDDGHTPGGHPAEAHIPRLHSFGRRRFDAMPLDALSARRVYDRIGRFQDSQHVYEDVATGCLTASGTLRAEHFNVRAWLRTGRYAASLLATALPPTSTYVGVDVSPKMVSLSRSRLAPLFPRARVELLEPPALVLPAGAGTVDRFVAAYAFDLSRRMMHRRCSAKLLVCSRQAGCWGSCLSQRTHRSKQDSLDQLGGHLQAVATSLGGLRTDRLPRVDFSSGMVNRAL